MDATIARTPDTAPDPGWTAFLSGMEKRCPGVTAWAAASARNRLVIDTAKAAMRASAPEPAR